MKKKYLSPLLALTLGLAAIAPPATAALPLAVDGQELPSLAPMLDRVRPAVVNISTTGRVRVQENPLFQDPFFRHFFGVPEQAPRERRTQSLGSGVIVDAKQGYILTNAHVVEKADEIKVTLQNGRELSAKLVGADPETDVAVIQVDSSNVKLTEVPIGDSGKLRVGDFVVAVGNPFGLGQTATTGIVSALERSGLGIEGYEDFIQTDASINPGNSGGALVNLRGELIGINTAILAPSGGNIGIGFAIPINMARTVADQLIKHGEVKRGQIGISVQDLTPALAEAFGVDLERGVVIAQVLPGSAAEQAGLKTGDVITAVNGHPVATAAAVRNRIGLMRVGESAKLTIVRDGKSQEITVSVREPFELAGSAGDVAPKLAGAEFAEVVVTEGNDKRTRVGVSRVQPGSPAASAGLRDGDIILSVNRRPVSTLGEFRKAVQASKGKLLLHVRRGNGAFFLLIQ